MRFPKCLERPWLVTGCLPSKGQSYRGAGGRKYLGLAVEESVFLCGAASPHSVSANLGGLACPDVR